jgi:hypothetical protein
VAPEEHATVFHLERFLETVYCSPSERFLTCAHLLQAPLEQ